MKPLVLKIYRRILEKDHNNTDAMLGTLLTSPNLSENLGLIKGWIAKGINFPRFVISKPQDFQPKNVFRTQKLVSEYLYLN